MQNETKRKPNYAVYKTSGVERNLRQYG